METELAEVTAAPSEGLPPPTATDEAVTADATAVTASPSEAAEGEPPAAAEKPQPAWASVADVYDLLDLPEVKDVRDRDDRRRDEGKRAEFEREFEAKHRDWESTNLSRTFHSAMGRVLERLDVGDTEGFTKALDRVEALMEPHGEATRTQAVRDGALAAANDFKGLFYKGLDRRSSDELDDLMRRATTWEELFEFREKARIDRAVEPLKKKLADAEAQIEALKVGARNGQGPSLTTGSSSGGGYRTKAEARKLHADNLISDDEMRQVKLSTLPDR